MIDFNYANKIVEDKIGPEYEIYNIEDTELYTFLFWKIKKYLIHDERGLTAGTGPIIYDKKNDKFEVLSSADWFYDDWISHLKKEVSEVQPRDIGIWDKILDEKPISNSDREWILNKTRKEISERNWVNTDDIQMLCYFSGIGPMIIGDVIKFHKGLNPMSHISLIFPQKVSAQKFIELWKTFGYPYEKKSELEYIVWKSMYGEDYVEKD